VPASQRWSGSPAYVERSLARYRVPRAFAARDLFMHLGYWDEPDRAGRSGEALVDAQERLNNLVLDCAQLRAGMCILDAGCGFGGTVAAARQRVPQLTCIGVNRDPRQLAVAVQAVRDGSFVLADAGQLPITDGSVDVVLAVECAFHFASRRQFCAEAARVLRPGGHLVTTDFIAVDAARALTTADRTSYARRLLDGLAPWPDPWNAEGNPDDLAHSVGLAARIHRDLTPGVLPSYACFLSDWPSAPRHADPVDEAVHALGTLQRCGVLRMELRAFERIR